MSIEPWHRRPTRGRRCACGRQSPPNATPVHRRDAACPLFMRPPAAEWRPNEGRRVDRLGGVAGAGCPLVGEFPLPSGCRRQVRLAANRSAADLAGLLLTRGTQAGRFATVGGRSGCGRLLPGLRAARCSQVHTGRQAPVGRCHASDMRLSHCGWNVRQSRGSPAGPGGRASEGLPTGGRSNTAGRAAQRRARGGAERVSADSRATRRHSRRTTEGVVCSLEEPVSAGSTTRAGIPCRARALTAKRIATAHRFSAMSTHIRRITRDSPNPQSRRRTAS